MKKFFRLFLLFLVLGLFVSCETDFKVIADYKEVAIVYGLLNQNDTIHYLRINKAFLGDGNALTYAQVADSSSFGNDINVVLIEKPVSGAEKEIVFDKVTLYNKEAGDFYSPGQLFYYSKAKFSENNSYKLKITNKRTGYEVSSQTNLIHDFSITKPPMLGPTSISFKRSSTSKNKFIWQNAINGRRYQFKVYFNYKELGIKGDTTYKKVLWIFPEQVGESIDGDYKIEANYVNEDFFKVCETKIPYSDQAAEDAVIKRFASKINLEVAVIGDEFNTYLEANGPSTGILMEKPVYSNITNGLGLFSSKYEIKRAPLDLGPETVLDLNAIEGLKFAKPSK
ncbi:MAG: DUF4249 family protein [Bacteroidales bacterium]